MAPGRARPTVYDVATHANVSIATVSRVLRRPDEVAASTAERVLRAVHELGYVPSGSARGLAARRSGAIGVCFPEFDRIEEPTPAGAPANGPVTVRKDPPGSPSRSTNLYVGEVLHGVETAAWEHQMSATVAITGGDRAAARVEDLAGKVDGLVVLAGTIADDVLDRIARTIPVVVLAGPRTTDPADRHDHITTANAAGTQELVRHLVTAHGLHDVRYIGGTDWVPDDVQRAQGYRSALEACGLPAPEPLDRGDFSEPSGRAVGHRLLQRGELPQALVCANDQMAIGLLNVLTDGGVRVPDEVRITGYDGIDATGWSRPRLTTVRQPMHRLGHMSVDLLLRRISLPSAPPLDEVLPVEILLRESCGCQHES